MNKLLNELKELKARYDRLNETSYDDAYNRQIQGETLEAISTKIEILVKTIQKSRNKREYYLANPEGDTYLLLGDGTAIHLESGIFGNIEPVGILYNSGYKLKWVNR